MSNETTRMRTEKRKWKENKFQVGESEKKKSWHALILSHLKTLKAVFIFFKDNMLNEFSRLSLVYLINGALGSGKWTREKLMLKITKRKKS